MVCRWHAPPHDRALPPVPLAAGAAKPLETARAASRPGRSDAAPQARAATSLGIGNLPAKTERSARAAAWPPGRPALFVARGVRGQSY
jgi:hypothetical protein